MQEHFDELVNKFCTGTEIPLSARTANRMLFEADKVAFSLEYQPKVDPEIVFLYTDFGPPPKKLKAQAYAMLLEMNFLDFLGKSGSYGISAATKNVVYVEEIDLNKATPELLHTKCAYLSQQAQEWRLNHYIGDGPVAKGPSAKSKTPRHPALLS